MKKFLSRKILAAVFVGATFLVPATASAGPKYAGGHPHFYKGGGISPGVHWNRGPLFTGPRAHGPWGPRNFGYRGHGRFFGYGYGAPYWGGYYPAYDYYDDYDYGPDCGLVILRRGHHPVITWQCW